MADIEKKEKNTIKENSEKESTAMTTFVAPSAPTKPAEVATFVAQGRIAIKAAVEVMKSCPANSGLYSQALDFAQKVAGMVLDEGVKIAESVRAVGNTLGSGDEVDKAREEKEKIMTSFGFQEGKRFRNICELDADCVKKAKDNAIKKGDIPTINAAIKLKPKSTRGHKLPIYECHGIFSDTVLTDDIKFDETWNATSLFANIGLGTYMLKDLNIEIAVANELEPKYRVPIHQELYPKCDVIKGSSTCPDGPTAHFPTSRMIFYRIVKNDIRNRFCDLFRCFRFPFANLKERRCICRNSARQIRLCCFLIAFLFHPCLELF